MKEFEITKEQSEYLATLFHNQCMLVLGSAGTGKSILGIEAVRRQINNDSESKILYLCSNAPFKQQIKDVMSNETIPLDNVVIDTFSNCFGLNFKYCLKKNRRQIIKYAEYLYQFSLIIIDEAQELNSVLLYDLKILANHSKVYIFGDEEQRIQNKNDDSDEEEWQQTLEISNPIRLKKNYRNPKNIVALAQRLSKFEDEQIPARTDEAKIYIKYAESEEIVKRYICDFQKYHTTYEIITILPDSWSKNSSILNELSWETGREWFTVKQSLGIESENIVVIVEGLFDTKLKSLLYTAITRTLGDLEVIFYVGKDKFGNCYLEENIEKFKQSDICKIFSEYQAEEKDDVL